MNYATSGKVTLRVSFQTQCRNGLDALVVDEEIERNRNAILAQHRGVCLRQPLSTLVWLAARASQRRLFGLQALDGDFRAVRLGIGLGPTKCAVRKCR